MINIVYWTQTGNTGAMAEAIAEGVKKSGKEAKAVEVSSITVAELLENDVFALGCPAMGAENLEETEMEPFVTELEKSISGKKVALFGSYGWGDGTWMRDWTDRMKNAGATVINDEGLICQDMPDDGALKQCTELGIKLAQ